ncbi:MAG: hypothetical protein HXX14_02220 [Bacteroidetes bacterium]|nr:hypothetical protein [Bacteroidota bacterium]
MLLKIFRSQSPIQFLLILIIGLLLWTLPDRGASIQPPANFDSGIYRYISGLFVASSSFSRTIAFIIIIFQAALLNYLLIKNNLAAKNSLLPSFLLILFYCSTPSVFQLSAPLISSFFILLAVAELASMYELKYAFTESFNASFFITIASFFYFPAFIFILLPWVSFLIYRIVSWREWVISFIGMTSAILIFAFFYFWNNKLLNVWTSIIQFFENPLRFHIQLSTPEIIIWSIVGLILLSAIFNLMNHVNEKIIAIRRKYLVSLLLFIISILSFTYADSNYRFHLAFLASPVVIILNNTLMSRKKQGRAELILWILIFAVIASRTI